MATKRELWEQLDNESNQAYRAFQIYRGMPSAERSMDKAWRIYVGNPNSKRQARHYSKWTRDYAWTDRAKAYDAHIDRIRRKGFEKAIEKEAMEHARTTENIMYQTNELLVRAYEKAIERLDSEDFGENLRPNEVINIIKLHVEAASKIAGTMAAQEAPEGTWTEEDDNEFANTILADIDERRAKGQSLPDDFGEEKEGPT